MNHVPFHALTSPFFVINYDAFGATIHALFHCEEHEGREEVMENHRFPAEDAEFMENVFINAPGGLCVFCEKPGKLRVPSW